MTDHTIEKFRALERRLRGAHGRFRLFALFRKEGPGDYWDLLVSARWLDDSGMEGRRIITSELQMELTKDELLMVSGVAVLGATAPITQQLPSLAMGEGVKLHFRDSYLNGFFLKEAVVITSQPLA